MGEALNRCWHDEKMAADYERHAEDGAYNAHYDRPAVLGLLGDVSGKIVLDAGCGPGFYLAELVTRNASATGFDISPAMVDRARARVAGLSDVCVASLDERLPYASSRFDVVLCALALHYAADRRATLREFARVLKPCGAVVLSTQHPTADWLRKGGSYFDVRLETDIWKANPHGRRSDWAVRFWREPLTALCQAVYDAGFLIERLVEPQPAATMVERDPQAYDELLQRPAFLAMRLLKRDAH